MVSVLILCGTAAFAQTFTYYQSAGDGADQSSVNNTGRWYTEAGGGGTQAPSAPSNVPAEGILNHYVSSLLLRTPLNSNTYTFNAESLTLNTGGKLFFKSQQPGGNIFTVTGTTILNGGILDQNTAQSTTNAPVPQTFRSAALVIGTAGGTIQQSQGGTMKANMIMEAPLVGNGTLLLTNTGNNGGGIFTTFNLTFQGDNSAYSGDITINNTSAYNNASLNSLTTVLVGIGSSLGTGSITLDHAGALDLTASASDALFLNSGLAIGNSAIWRIDLAADTTYNLQSFTYNEALYDVIGFTIGGIGSGANLELSQIFGGGWFEITAIPEPSTFVLLGIGFITLCFLRKKFPHKKVA
jgi:hypothetical protein